MVFDAYAHYYDLLYCDKDYDGEVKFINGLIQEHAPKARCLLELGCGTGIHAEKFTRRNYIVHDVNDSAHV